jgi:hypothetical protein
VDAAHDLLARYGFRLAVLSDADLESPGLAALANGFATGSSRGRTASSTSLARGSERA